MTEAIERDRIDDLIDALNDGVDGIIFDRDVLDTNRPDDWGAVELTGEDDADWADGTMIDQTLTADIWICVSDRGSWPKRSVQRVLKEFCPEIVAGWRFVNRAYLYDLDKVMWHWTVSIDGPLAPEDTEDSSGDEEPAVPADSSGDEEADEPDDAPVTQEDPEEDE